MEESREIQRQMTEAQIEREAVRWLEEKEAALRRKRSNFKPRRGQCRDRRQG